MDTPRSSLRVSKASPRKRLAAGGALAFLNRDDLIRVPLLLANEFYGERVNLFDVKLAKNSRFSGKTLALGVDIYNIFNSDGITSYNTTFTRDNPATSQNENQWGLPMLIVPPRFVRMQIQFNF